MTTEFNDAVEATQGATQGQPAKRKLGIGKEVQAKAGIPIGAPKRLDKRTAEYPNSYEFPVVQLVNVSFVAEKEIKRNGEEEKVPVLQMVFVQKGGKQFTQIYFPIDDEDEKFESKLGEMHQSIKHIFDETVGVNNFVEGSMEGEDFAEFFSNVAIAFNAKKVTRGEGETAKTVPYYQTQYVYLKLSYYKERLQLPKFPNFIQKAVTGTGQPIPCELLISPKFDKLEPEAPAKATGTYGGGAQNSTFGGDGDFTDFPDIPNM